MCGYHLDELLAYHNQVFQELYKVDTLIKLTKKICEEKEFKGQYYGFSNKDIENLSSERNDYINMLTIISDSVAFLIKLNLNIESVIKLDYNKIPTIEADK